MCSPLDNRSRHEALFSLFGACHHIVSRSTFVEEVYPLLKYILPHERFLCGIASVAPLTVLDSVNAGVPATFIDDCIDSEQHIRSPLIRKWLTEDSPVYFDGHPPDLVTDPGDRGWLEMFNHHKMQNMAAHGTKDLHGGATSYFCFAGLPVWNAEIKALLRTIVPHLHSALRSHYLLKIQQQEHELSLREREVLKLVCVGKTNHAIGEILGISPWTVKIHVRNFMFKLNVSTRGHAAAKAMKDRLVDV
jgi:DNA-binding CsgD family transcriptional regulator